MKLAQHVLFVLASVAMVLGGDALSLRASISSKMMARTREAGPQFLSQRPSSGTSVLITGTGEIAFEGSCAPNEAVLFFIPEPIEGEAPPFDFFEVCGSSCSMTNRLDEIGLSGGAQCLGDTSVTATLRGVSNPFFAAEGAECLLFTDREPETTPANRQALIACGLFDQFVAAPVVAAGNTIARVAVQGVNGVVTGFNAVQMSVEVAIDKALDATKGVIQQTADEAERAARLAAEEAERVAREAAEQAEGAAREAAAAAERAARQAAEAAERAAREAAAQAQRAAREAAEAARRAFGGFRSFF